MPMVMDKRSAKHSTMIRQLKIYYRLTASEIIGPNDIMREFGI